MADLYGVSEAEVNLYDPLRRAQAREALGRVAMQPAEQKLKEAHAMDYQAQAQERMQKVRQAAELEQLSAEALANGETVGAEEAQQFLSSQGQSLAAPLERVYRAGVKKGTSTATLMPLAEKIATIREKEAKAGGNQYAQQEKFWKAQQAQAARFGSLAQAGLQGPQQWAMLRLQTPELNHLPQSWEMARPYLENLANSAMEVDKSLELERKRARDAVLAKVSDSTIARNKAAAGAAEAASTLRTYKYEQTKKNNGIGDPVTAEAKKLDVRLKKLKIEKAQLAIAPLVPTKDLLQENTAYTLPGGRIGIWQKDPASGQLGFAFTTLEDLANLEEEDDEEESE